MIPDCTLTKIQQLKAAECVNVLNIAAAITVKTLVIAITDTADSPTGVLARSGGITGLTESCT